LHLSRKLFHLSGVVIVLVWSLLGLERGLAIALLWACVALLALVDLLRPRLPALRMLFERSFAAILDPKDLRGFNGSTLYFAGCALAATLFAPEVAWGGILALAVGDSSAAVVGSSVRSPRWGKVSLAGSGACVLFATVAILLLRAFAWPVALAGGVAAALLEAFSGSKMDNLTMPVGVALVLHLLG